MSKELLRKDWAEIYKSISDGVPVTVKDALIEMPQNLQLGRVSREFNLINCVIRGAFTGKNVLFAESVSFIGTIFENGLNLDGCSIEGNLQLSHVTIKEKASFEGFAVARQAFFDDSTFEVEPTFVLARFGPFTRFQNVKLCAGASFISASFSGYFTIDNSPDCNGPISLSLATVDGPLSVTRSKFSGPFTGDALLVSGPAILTDLEFGPDAILSLFRATVEGQLKLQRCTFKNEKAGCLNLGGIAISGGCEMDHLTCAGGFQMIGARISRFFWIGVENTKNPTHHDTFFAQGFSLSEVRIDGALTCTGIAFAPLTKDGTEAPIAPDDQVEPPDFSGMRVDGRVYIIGCKFPRGANYNRAEISGVFGLSADFERSVSFEGTYFEKGVRFLPGTILRKGAEFYFAQFGEEANFGGSRIGEQLSLRYAQINHSLLFEMKREDGQVSAQFLDDENKTGPVPVLLRGCSYARLVLPDDFSSLREFLARVPSTDKNAFVYLEQYLRKSGRRERADEVRIHWNECERQRMAKPRVNRSLLVLAVLLGLATVAANHVEKFQSQLKIFHLALSGILLLLAVPIFNSRWFWRSAQKYLTRYGTTPNILLAAAMILGVANVAAPYFDVPNLWLKTFQVGSATLGAFLLTLAADALRRRVWPD